MVQIIITVNTLKPCRYILHHHKICA